MTNAPSSQSIDVDPVIAQLLARPCWIFDMDGTLTHAVHDFEAIRVELGLPPGQPILEAIDTLPADEAEHLTARLYDIELDLAREATAQPGARALLERLRARGRRIGIVTRNSEALAHVTLAASGLDDLFEPALVLGRERCPPKPDPAGLLWLMAEWQAAPAEVVMVGDYLFDLQAGRGAGAMTVHFNRAGAPGWADHSDVVIGDFDCLLEHL